MTLKGRIGYIGEMKVIRIYKNDDGNKEWIDVKFEVLFVDDNKWRPKLEELAIMARLIYEVEDNKYQRGRGGEMVRDYLNDALNGMPIMELNKKYELPDADQNKDIKFGYFKTNEN